MKLRIARPARSVLLGLFALTIFTLGSSAAQADEVTIVGSSTGTLSASVSPPLTFAGNSFDSTTALGIGSLSGANRLGTFTLATSAERLLSGTFTLNITFTQPTGIATGQNTTFTATVMGSVSPTEDRGGVNVVFNPNAMVFAFSNATGTGMFSLTIPNLFVQTGRSADLSAGITGAQQRPNAIPEPATLLLLGTGLTGLGAGLRRRYRTSKGRISDIN